MGFDISNGQLGHAMENRMSAGTQLLDLGTASVLCEKLIFFSFHPWINVILELLTCS